MESAVASAAPDELAAPGSTEDAAAPSAANASTTDGCPPDTMPLADDAAATHAADGRLELPHDAARSSRRASMPAPSARTTPASADVQKAVWSSVAADASAAHAAQNGSADAHGSRSGSSEAFASGSLLPLAHNNTCPAHAQTSAFVPAARSRSTPPTHIRRRHLSLPPVDPERIERIAALIRQHKESLSSTHEPSLSGPSSPSDALMHAPVRSATVDNSAIRSVMHAAEQQPCTNPSIATDSDKSKSTHSLSAPVIVLGEADPSSIPTADKSIVHITETESRLHLSQHSDTPSSSSPELNCPQLPEMPSIGDSLPEFTVEAIMASASNNLQSMSSLASTNSGANSVHTDHATDANHTFVYSTTTFSASGNNSIPFVYSPDATSVSASLSCPVPSNTSGSSVDGLHGLTAFVHLPTVAHSPSLKTYTASALVSEENRDGGHQHIPARQNGLHEDAHNSATHAMNGNADGKNAPSPVNPSLPSVASSPSKGPSKAYMHLDPIEVGKQLYDGTLPDCPKNNVAIILGKNDEYHVAVLESYMSGFDFTGIRLDEALRLLCSHLDLAGETQMVDRILYRFSQRYWECNPESHMAYRSVDVVYGIQFSLVLLNTDLHRANIGNSAKRMTRKAFLKNVMRLIDELVEADVKVKEDIYSNADSAKKWKRDLELILKDLYASVASQPVMKSVSAAVVAGKNDGSVSSQASPIAQSQSDASALNSSGSASVGSPSSATNLSSNADVTAGTPTRRQELHRNDSSWSVSSFQSVGSLFSSHDKDKSRLSVNFFRKKPSQSDKPSGQGLGGYMRSGLGTDSSLTNTLVSMASDGGVGASSADPIHGWHLGMTHGSNGSQNGSMNIHGSGSSLAKGGSSTGSNSGIGSSGGSVSGSNSAISKRPEYIIEGFLIRKHVLEKTDQRAKNRKWTKVWAGLHVSSEHGVVLEMHRISPSSHRDKELFMQHEFHVGGVDLRPVDNSNMSPITRFTTGEYGSDTSSMASLSLDRPTDRSHAVSMTESQKTNSPQSASPTAATEAGGTTPSTDNVSVLSQQVASPEPSNALLQCAMNDGDSVSSEPLSAMKMHGRSVSEIVPGGSTRSSPAHATSASETPLSTSSSLPPFPSGRRSMQPTRSTASIDFSMSGFASTFGMRNSMTLSPSHGMHLQPTLSSGSSPVGSSWRSGSNNIYNIGAGLRQRQSRLYRMQNPMQSITPNTQTNFPSNYEVMSLLHAYSSALQVAYSSSRLHVFNVKLPGGAEYLFQAPTLAHVGEWVRCINYWAARKSKEPIRGAVSSSEYGWTWIQWERKAHEAEFVHAIASASASVSNPAGRNASPVPSVEVTPTGDAAASFASDGGRESDESHAHGYASSVSVISATSTLGRHPMPASARISMDGHVSAGVSSQMSTGPSVGASVDGGHTLKAGSASVRSMQIGESDHVVMHTAFRAAAAAAAIKATARRDVVSSAGSSGGSASDLNASIHKRSAVRPKVSEWFAPTGFNRVVSSLSDDLQLDAMMRQVDIVKTDIVEHLSFRQPIDSFFCESAANHHRAVANWDRRLRHLEQELQKFTTYVRALSDAREQNLHQETHK